MINNASHIEIINIVVCYNNVSEIKQYINELNSMDNCSWLMLVIVGNDNSCENDFFEEINNSNFIIQYFKSPGNIGYMKGFIYGYLKCRDIKPKWYIMSNTDILYPDKFFISKLLAKEYKNICCIGPSIFVPETGAYQNPMAVNRITRLRLKRHCLIFNNRLSGSVYILLSNLKKKFKTFKKDKISKKIYLAHGAYMIFSPDLMNAMNQNPFEPFLYSEELYVAEVARLMKKDIYYDADLKIIHNEHSVTGKTNLRKKICQMHESYLWIYKKFFAN